MRSEIDGRRAQSPGTPTPRLPALDGLRGYAILAVVVLHVLGASGVLASIEGTRSGVVVWALLGNPIDVFMIISGFVLFLPAVRRGTFGSVREYALDRAARLFPAYWMSLLLALGLIAFVPLSPAIGPPSFFNLAVNAAAVQNPARLISAGVSSGFGANAPLWIISVLVGFYVVLPLVARPYLRHPVLGLALGAAITLLWKEAAVHAGADLVAPAARSGASPGILKLIVTDQLPGWAFSFAAGMTAAWLYVRAIEPDPRGQGASRALRLMLIAVPVYVATSYLYGRAASVIAPTVGGAEARSDPVIAVVGTASRATLIVAVALAPVWVQRPFVSRAGRWLAQRSYGLYLTHGLVLTVCAGAIGLRADGSALAAAAWAGIVVPVSLGCASLSNRYIERPIGRWVRARTRRTAPRSPEPQRSPVAAGWPP